MVALNRYHQDVAAARSEGLALAADREAELMVLLAEYGDRLGKLVRAGIASGNERRVYAEVNALFAALARDVRRRTRTGIRLTAERVALLHARAVRRVVRSSGRDSLAARLYAEVRGVGSQAATAVLARPELAATFRSIPTEWAEQANRVIRRGLLRGAPPGAIERELRMFIGAPGSLAAGDEELLTDLRRIGYATIEELGYEPTRENLLLVRGEAGRIRDRARLIARQETATAEHEAHVRAVEVSTLVRAVRVRLSATHPVPDQCDVAAAANLYGLGPGRYPPTLVPARFHVRCLCMFLHELRPAAEWGTPLPKPPRLRARWDALSRQHGLSDSQLRALQAAVGVAHARHAPAGAT